METLHIYGNRNVNCNTIVFKLSLFISERVTTPAYGHPVTYGILKG